MGEFGVFGVVGIFGVLVGGDWKEKDEKEGIEEESGYQWNEEGMGRRC